MSIERLAGGAHGRRVGAQGQGLGQGTSKAS